MHLKNRDESSLGSIAPILLPILSGIVPTLYHYSNNVKNLVLTNLYQMLALNILWAILVYFLLLVLYRFEARKASIAAFLFLVYFNVYGLVYRYLLDADIIRIKHYTFLPLVLMLAIYSMFGVTQLKNSILLAAWRNLILMISALVLINSTSIALAETKRWWSSRSVVVATLQEEISLKQNRPDIYYIVLDEFAGFQAMRDYWNYEEVDDFVRFLTDRGFFIAEASHGASKSTLHETTSRLNYQTYSLDMDTQIVFNHRANNRVMRYLKAQGYTTVVFDEMKLGVPAAKPIEADYLYVYGDPSILQESTITDRLYLDEFGQLILGNTMLSVIPRSYYNRNAVTDPHYTMIRYTVEHVADPAIPSPKFVYVHLLLPHPPFMFTRDGDIEFDHFTDWNYYLDNYIYSIKVAQEMINNILLEADSANPPVIILQSDHGARMESNVESIFLPNYPEEYKTLIMNAFYIPGYDYSTLSQNLDPVNTFPIVFNYLFDTNIPLVK